jgi:SAM-dependent methyltransferase
MMIFRRTLFSAIFLVALCTPWATLAAQERLPDVRFVPTPEEVVTEMLRMAKVTKDDVVYDLGCGDGRIVITAAKVFGARGIGIDMDQELIKESTQNAVRAGVTDRVKFLQQDLFTTDLREATVVFLYLLTELNEKLRPKLLRELKPGSRVISHEFDMGDWKPDDKGMMPDMDIFYDLQRPSKKDLYYYFWVIPADVAGAWRWSVPTKTGERKYALRLSQKYQEIDGFVKSKEREIPVSDTRLKGDRISFTVKDEIDGKAAVMRFAGQVNGDIIQGAAEILGGPFAGKHNWTARRTP